MSENSREGWHLYPVINFDELECVRSVRPAAAADAYSSLHHENLKYTTAVRSKMSSKLIFVSCA